MGTAALNALPQDRTMTHKPNRTNLPPAKSADEYEREIAALQAKVEELEKSLLSRYWPTPSKRPLSPKGEA